MEAKLRVVEHCRCPMVCAKPRYSSRPQELHRGRRDKENGRQARRPTPSTRQRRGSSTYGQAKPHSNVKEIQAIRTSVVLCIKA